MFNKQFEVLDPIWLSTMAAYILFYLTAENFLKIGIAILRTSFGALDQDHSNDNNTRVITANHHGVLLMDKIVAAINPVKSRKAGVLSKISPARKEFAHHMSNIQSAKVRKPKTTAAPGRPQ